MKIEKLAKDCSQLCDEIIVRFKIVTLELGAPSFKIQ